MDQNKSSTETHDEKPRSRYVVGIDLGTTNSAICYVDTAEEPWRVRTFAVPQPVAPGQIEARESLPSFHYQPAAGEFAAGALRMPWMSEDPAYAVGFFARDHGTLVPGRLINSAKSWLCHTGVDRTAELLPWQGAPDVDRLSPVEVSARYLQHVRDAWDHRFADSPLAGQDLVVTLPASFDEVARELTVEAAKRAGLPRVVLIEEPQAAFYAWIDAHRDDWERRVEPGQKILVCDIGGGTTDFTLIRVRRAAGEKVQFHRVAVGEHLILGGDNLDLALAHHIERRLAGDGRLEPRQWSVLVRACRQVKETLLGADAPERLTVNLPGTGARLLGGGVQVEVTRDEVRAVLVDGFLPKASLDEKPSRRQSGFQEFGLPFAADAGITRYLAAFLTAHRHVALDDADARGDHDPARPDIVLFNGGFFASPVLRGRLLDVLASWFRTEDADWMPIVLQNDRLDLAVARGAAYYGMVRRGEGVRIAAGLARTYYIGVEGVGQVSNLPFVARHSVAEQPPRSGGLQRPHDQWAICLVPAGVEPGQTIDLTERRFDLLVSEPVEFPLYVSSTRLTDRPGEIVPVDREQMTPLPPIRTVLRTSRQARGPRPAGTPKNVVSVHLHAGLTEIGTLDLWCGEIDGRRSWKLRFDVRSATQTDVAAHQGAAEREGVLDEETWQACRRLIESTFTHDTKSRGPRPAGAPKTLVKDLTETIGTHRNEWPASLLRNIWEVLMEVDAGRRLTQQHEARWLNLLGFSLRPGYGLAVDDWRVATTWKELAGGLVHNTPACRAEWWILWRRIGGGLDAGQQQSLANPLIASLRRTHRQLTTGSGRGGDLQPGSHESAEVWRLVGSLERLDPATKIELGNMIVDLFPKRKMESDRPALVWALGRLGARVPVYGPLNAVVPSDTAGKWLNGLMDFSDDSTAQLAAMQMARRTGDRYRDLPDALRDRVLKWLQGNDAPPHFVELVGTGGELDRQEQGLVFGEALPAGLRIL